MSREVCEFQLIGGLGNQLFIMMAATQHLRDGYPTEINTFNLESYGNNHGTSIEGIVFPFKTPEYKETKTNLSAFKFRLISLLRRKAKFKNIANWQIENEHGFSDPSHARNAKGRKHLGYFQSPKMFDSSLKPLLFDIAPQLPSENFVHYSNEAEKIKPIFLHIRRGDYLTYQDTFGVLSMDYYENALNVLRKKGIHFSEVWIISSEEAIGSELGMKLGVNFRVVSAASKLSDIETLILMKYGSAHIIANSTYSWWGAFISKNTKCVVAPSPWFKNEVIPQSLIPENWVEVESLWI